MPLIDLTLDDVSTAAKLPICQMKLWTLMLWPDDEVLRRSVVLSAYQEFLEQRAINGEQPITLGPEFLRFRGKRVDARQMVENATANVVEGSAKSPHAPNRTPGVIAGDVLLNAFHLQDQDREAQVRLTDCLKMESEYLINGVTKQRGQGARVEDLRPHWHRYRNVAHLWAAQITSDHAALTTNDLSKFRTFLVLAELFAERGATIGSKHAQSQILDPTLSWRVHRSLVESIFGAEPTLRSFFVPS